MRVRCTAPGAPRCRPAAVPRPRSWSLASFRVVCLATGSRGRYLRSREWGIFRISARRARQIGQVVQNTVFGGKKRKKRKIRRKTQVHDEYRRRRRLASGRWPTLYLHILYAHANNRGNGNLTSIYTHIFFPFFCRFSSMYILYLYYRLIVDDSRTFNVASCPAGFFLAFRYFPEVFTFMHSKITIIRKYKPNILHLILLWIPNINSYAIYTDCTYSNCWEEIKLAKNSIL